MMSQDINEKIDLDTGYTLILLIQLHQCYQIQSDLLDPEKQLFCSETFLHSYEHLLSFHSELFIFEQFVSLFSVHEHFSAYF